MKRQALYSSAKQTPGAGQTATGSAAAPAPATSPRLQRLRALGVRHAGVLQFLGGAAFVALLAAGATCGRNRRRVR